MANPRPTNWHCEVRCGANGYWIRTTTVAINRTRTVRFYGHPQNGQTKYCRRSTANSLDTVTLNKYKERRYGDGSGAKAVEVAGYDASEKKHSLLVREEILVHDILALMSAQSPRSGAAWPRLRIGVRKFPSLRPPP